MSTASDRQADSFASDEYLSAAEVRTLFLLLQEQLTGLMDQSRAALNTLTGPRENDADAIDLAVTESNRDFSLRMADRDRRLMAKIRHALRRIENGEYGACEVCGSEITNQRLLARPVATQCIDCKTEAEQLESRRRVF